MARADFYILTGNTTASRFSCSIAGKAWSSGNSVYILVRDSEEAARIDDLLWTYQDISFLPHARVDTPDSGTPVLIGWPGVTPPQSDVMINLTDSVPEYADRFQRVIEIIPEDPVEKDRGRARYRTYRKMGFDMFNHTINTEQ